MARMSVTTLVDDLDPTGNTEANKTVTFHDLDGNKRVIDLCDHNSEVFLKVYRQAEELLARYVAVSRVVKVGKSPRRTSAARVSSNLCRRWNREVKGRTDINDRGRIPADAVKDWEDAGSPRTW